MMRALSLRWRSVASLAFADSFVALPAPHRQGEQPLGPGLVWRNVGPFRAGRISAVSGAVGQPGGFYAGLSAVPAPAVRGFTKCS